MCFRTLLNLPIDLSMLM
jgi:heme/copper-type cytochrome/quinol oxidase subunit 1